MKPQMTHDWAPLRFQETWAELDERVAAERAAEVTLIVTSDRPKRDIDRVTVKECCDAVRLDETAQWVAYEEITDQPDWDRYRSKMKALP